MDKNEVMSEIQEIWNKSLGRESDITKDYFQNGGDSFKAAIMCISIQKRYNITIDLKDVFKESSFSSIVDHVVKQLT